MKMMTCVIALAALVTTSLVLADTQPDRKAFLLNKGSDQNLPMSIQVFRANYGPVDRAAFYMEGTAGYSEITTKIAPGVTGSDFGWVFASGYQFNRYFATETGYLRLPEITSRGAHANMGIFHILGVYLIPVIPDLHFMVKGGIGLSHLTDNSNGSYNLQTGNHFCLFAGAGVEYFISFHVGVIGQGLVTLQKKSSGGAIEVPGSISGLIGLTYKGS